MCSRGRAVASMLREATYMCIRVSNPSSLSIIYDPTVNRRRGQNVRLRVGDRARAVSKHESFDADRPRKL